MVAVSVVVIGMVCRHGLASVPEPGTGSAGAGLPDERSDPAAEPDDPRPDSGTEWSHLERAQRVDEPFLPSRHGFAFVNRFTGSPLPPELRDASGGVLLWARQVAERYAELPSEFGLCGGMSLSAADHYLSGASIPEAGEPPEQGSPLYEELYRRQRDSLGVGASMVLRFAHWMGLPDSRHEGGEGPSASCLMREELPAICRALERGELTPLGLVLTRRGQGKLWNNHQVLGYRLERVDPSTLHVFIYDPNYPGDDACRLRIEGPWVGMLGAEGAASPEGASQGPDAASPGGEIRVRRITGRGQVRVVRGVFAMPYEPASPAGAVTPSSVPGR